jgi:hypothetical protein
MHERTAEHMLNAREVQDPVKPNRKRFAILPGHNHEFCAVASAKIGRYDGADMHVASRITPAQSQPVVVHDGQFVFAVQATINGSVVSGFHVSGERREPA